MWESSSKRTSNAPTGNSVHGAHSSTGQEFSPHLDPTQLHPSLLSRITRSFLIPQIVRILIGLDWIGLFEFVYISADVASMGGEVGFRVFHWFYFVLFAYILAIYNGDFADWLLKRAFFKTQNSILKPQLLVGFFTNTHFKLKTPFSNIK